MLQTFLPSLVLAPTNMPFELLNEDSSVSSTFVSETNNCDIQDPTAGRVRTPSYSDSETGMSIMSSSDIEE